MPSTESLSDTLSRTLDVFVSRRESHAPLTTAEVADSLDCTRRAAYDRLERLVERGHLETKEVGGRENVWWLTEVPAEDGRDEGPGTDDTSEPVSTRLLENVPGMVYRCRNERGWPMEFVSDGCRELTGYDPEALERGEVSYGDDVVVEADRDELWTDIQNAVDDGEQFLVTYRIETASGEVRWVRERGRGVFDEEGKLDVLEGVIIDVTERKRLESEFDEMFGRISDAFYALDDQWQFTHANERAEELIDYQDEGLVGKNFWEVFEWATDSTLGEEYRTAMATQEPTSFEFYYPEPLDAWYEVHAYPSKTGLSVYFRDVTDRVERERELERSERRYRALVENFPNGAVALVDEDLHYRTVGGNPLDVADVTAEDIEDNPVREAIPEPLADELVPRYEAALEGESDSFEAEYDDRVFEFRVVPVRDDDGNVFAALGMSQDVTERTEYEQKIQESERRYRTLAENFPNGGVGVYDRDLRYTLVTGTMWDDIEPDAADLEGNTIWEALPPDTAEDVEPLFRAALDGETGSVVSSLGGRTYRVWATPLRDADGEITAGQSFALDITDQIEREQKLEETVEKLEESNERLERFASMLAHELRNPVTIGQIYSQQLPAETDSGADGSNSDAVEYVTEAFDRIEDMIDVMLVLTRGREAVGDSSPLSLADVTRDAWEKTDAPDATIEIEAEAVMQADETYVRHMFRNLFENSVEHGGSDVTVTVGELPTGFYVADDGPGIPPDERDVVFEAGYTTAADEGGTGLGLAFVEELAEVYGWDCDVTESEAGGARFEFRNVDSVTEA